MDNYELSGYNLPESFGPGDRVIHINCGNNPFKGMIPNFRAIDPVSPAADLKITVDHYNNTHKTNKFHVALILNGFDNYQPGQLDYYVPVVANLMVKRDAKIFWRTAIDNTYPWSFDEHTRLAALINYSIVAMTMETETEIYAEWGSNIRSVDYSA
jgi:hypothetical protein